MRAITLPLLVLLFSHAVFAANSKPTKRDIAAIVQAVQDEIYDWGYHKDYMNIGITGAISSSTDVPIFIFPEIDDRGVGGVIYRRMPFGEVVRQYTLHPDGFAVLHGDPLNGFPASQPDTRTIYIDDDFVCSYKQKAVRAYFTVDPNVSRARREEAARRQVARIGRSHYLEGLPKKESAPRKAQP